MHGIVDLKAAASKITSNSDVDDAARKSLVVTGTQLDSLDQAQMDHLCQYEEIVFARTTPEQKLRIVQEFKAREHVVAMTGDGVNDAPSLKAADCELSLKR